MTGSAPQLATDELPGPASLPPTSPLGVTLRGSGIDVAVHAPDAEAVAICFFDDRDHEPRRVLLTEPIGGVWHAHVPDVEPGTRYGLRAWGPWDPAKGLRFNPDKLLIDPYATALDRVVTLHPSLFDRDRPLAEDTAPFMAKGIVGAPPAGPMPNRPDFDWDRQVVYELHVRGFTMTHPDIPPAIRGTYAALAHPAAIRHLKRLGVTTVELMPSAAWTDERHLPSLNLTNYWGYNPIAYLAPDPRLAPGGWAEIRAAVDALHQAGLSVILDVVLNHSAESDELGPTLSLRGLGNAGYYRLAEDKALYVNDAGTGSVLAMERPAVLRLGLDALRAWAMYGGFDGFRLDLAATLGRGPEGFEPHGPFLAAVEQDPILSRLVFIAEPWDIGKGGYQLGNFPARWGEWNDRFRDTVRRFWRGDADMIGDFTTRVAGSADVFHDRPLNRSVNFVTAHDGFTLADLVSYRTKRNQANGENNHDGSDDSLSWNNGVEGPSSDPSVRAARSQDVRALLATLLLSRGTPMLTMGDEAGRTQLGNNNAYAQDNALSWFDWSAVDDALVDDTAALIALRQSLAPLFTSRPLTGKPGLDGRPDVVWRTADGGVFDAWGDPKVQTLIADLCAGSTRALIVFHAGREALALTLPAARAGRQWRAVLGSQAVASRTVAVFQEQSEPAPVMRTRHDRTSDAELEELSARAAIEEIWWDIDGNRHEVTAETKRTLLRAMRLPADRRDEWRDSMARLDALRDAPLPPALTVRVNQPVVRPLGTPRPAWVTLATEDGQQTRFHVTDGALRLPPLPMGRHRLLVNDDPAQVCHLTVAPSSCWLPPALEAGERRFGIAAHLYSLRSVGDQGIGDFSTLRRFAHASAEAGAAVVGLNPLHALFPHERERASPYHPSDRRFLDPIYIDVAGFPNEAALPSAGRAVDYPAVWAFKRGVLWDAFMKGASSRATVTVSGGAGWAFRAQAAFGLPALPYAPDPASAASLLRFAVFQAMAETLAVPEWHQWPAELRHPDSRAVAEFAQSHADLVRFHLFLQQLAEEQLAEAASGNGLSVGFYRDLAVGAAPDGAEAWAAQDALMHGVSVGSPPDPFSAQGQVWCLPPPDPLAMRREGFAGFSELLAANMRHAGALRIDHVLGLRRLFLVPEGATAASGAYVNYPLDDLLAQVALQSHRAQCLVVGEDLGTVPEGLSDSLAEAKLLSYSVLWFERRGERLRPPPEWKRLAAACVSTHDLPTLAGWWEGVDLTEKHALGLLPALDAALQEREQEKAALIQQLQEEELLDDDIGLKPPLPMTVAAAVHQFVSATPALLALVQADDLAGETVAVNLPGTDRERPNWRRRLDGDAATLLRTPLAQAILQVLGPRSSQVAAPATTR